jgi:uncharacterized protein
MTPRTLTPSREADRLSTDRAALDALLDDVLVGYVALSLAEGPLALPVSYARDGDRVLFHGSTGSRRMRSLAEGAEICFTVAAADGLKVGRTAFGTGMQFRSATLFGTCELLQGPEKIAALGRYTDRYLPGRMAEVRPITAREAAATMLLALPISEWSMKVAEGFAHDDIDEVRGDVWAGVVPWFQGVGDPIPSPDLGAGIAIPASVMALKRP